MDYTLQQLRYLVAVADHGSVSAAARSLYVSQPGLSSAILHLEDVFGLQCFVRHHAKGVTLTPAGHQFVKEARDVLSRASNLQQRAKELNKSVAGRLDVGCFPTIGAMFIPRILDRLHECYPGLYVRLQDGDSRSLQARVKQGDLELALLFDFSMDPSLEKLALLSLPPYVLLPRTHRLSSEMSINLADLADESLHLYDQGGHSAYLLSLFASIGKTPHIGQEVSDFELIRGLVAAGKGYAILHARPALDRAYDGNPLVCLPIRGIVPSAVVAVASPGSSSYTNRAAAFIEACQSVLGTFDSRACQWKPVKEVKETLSGPQGPMPRCESSASELIGLR